MKSLKTLSQDYQKPTPVKWRKIGDLAMFAIPVIELQLQAMPAELNPWFKWGITTFLVLFKAYTNTKVDNTIYEGKH